MDIFKKYHPFFRAEGIAFVVLGALAMALPQFTAHGISQLLGWLFLIAGIVQGVRLATSHQLPGFWPSLLFLLLTIMMAILLIGYPQTALILNSGVHFFAALFWLFFMLDGTIKITLALHYRRVEEWGWLLTSGIISLALSGIIWAGWPSTPSWEIGLLVGINMACYGLALLYLTYP